jgi:hypothetical protein
LPAAVASDGFFWQPVATNPTRKIQLIPSIRFKAFFLTSLLIAIFGPKFSSEFTRSPQYPQAGFAWRWDGLVAGGQQSWLPLSAPDRKAHCYPVKNQYCCLYSDAWRRRIDAKKLQSGRFPQAVLCAFNLFPPSRV